MRRLLERIAASLECRTIGINGSTYLRRFYVAGSMPPDLAAKWNGDRLPRERLGFLPTIYLHCFHRPDAGRDLHNHPWEGAGIVLAGGYEEIRVESVGGHNGGPAFGLEERRTLRPGALQRVRPGTYHRVHRLLGDGHCWTLFWVWGLTGKSWGYWLRQEQRHASWQEVHGADTNSHTVEAAA